ncbi:hypothetical protein PG993_004114 [Apiospora rasikravindrae]|uniref:NmrA-like domain-containing protein n=1 Tax=Apiospora rasikravindrae TaxID=990691 RepID=A0ABR1TDS0_9PEZI
MTLVAVLGATGAQGGSVANRLLADRDTYQVRALTRNPDGEAAKALLEKGAEVVFADVNDAASLPPALEGVEALFVVTAYWPSIPKLGRDGAGDEEVAQYQAVANAAAKTPSLRHVVLSTLPRCAKMSGGKFPVPHYDYKQIAVDWIRATHPDLWAKTTEFWPGWYTSNLATLMRPVPVPGSGGGYLLPLPSKPDAMLPMAGNLELNAGILVEAVLRAGPAKTGNKIAICITDYRPIREVADALTKLTGGEKRVAYAELSDAHNARLYGDFGTEMAAQLRWSEAYPDWHRFEPDRTLDLAADLGLEKGKLVNFEQALEAIKDQLF